MKLDVKIDEAAFKSKLEKGLRKKLNAGTRAGMSVFLQVAKSYAVRDAPARTGNLRRSITKETKGQGLNVQGILRCTARGADGQPYPKFVHDGTGIYGPRKDFIRFVSAGFGKRHYSTFSRGQKPQPFLQNGLDKAAPSAQAIFSAALKRALG